MFHESWRRVCTLLCWMTLSEDVSYVLLKEGWCCRPYCFSVCCLPPFRIWGLEGPSEALCFSASPDGFVRLTSFGSLLSGSHTLRNTALRAVTVLSCAASPVSSLAVTSAPREISTHLSLPLSILGAQRSNLRFHVCWNLLYHNNPLTDS